MGWTEFYVGHTNKTNKELMTEELERYGSIKVIKASVVNGVYYAAYQVTSKPERILAIVCLMRRSEKNNTFAYKDIDEEMGPFESKCPKSILDLLTPTESKYANEWRERCRAYANSKAEDVRKQLNALPIGTFIKANGDTTLYKHSPAYKKKRPFFMCANKFAYVPIKDIHTFEVIEKPAGFIVL